MPRSASNRRGPQPANCFAPEAFEEDWNKEARRADGSVGSFDVGSFWGEDDQVTEHNHSTGPISMSKYQSITSPKGFFESLSPLDLASTTRYTVLHMLRSEEVEGNYDASSEGNQKKVGKRVQGK